MKLKSQIALILFAFMVITPYPAFSQIKTDSEKSDSDFRNGQNFKKEMNPILLSSENDSDHALFKQKNKKVKIEESDFNLTWLKKLLSFNKWEKNLSKFRSDQNEHQKRSEEDSANYHNDNQSFNYHCDNDDEDEENDSINSKKKCSESTGCKKKQRVCGIYLSNLNSCGNKITASGVDLGIAKLIGKRLPINSWSLIAAISAINENGIVVKAVLDPITGDLKLLPNSSPSVFPPGSYTLRFTLKDGVKGSIPEVKVNVLIGDPALVLFSSNNLKQGVVGDTASISVNLYDVFNNLIPNSTVNINGTTVKTNSTGFASSLVLLNKKPGNQIISAMIPGNSESLVNYNILVVAGAPATIAFNSLDPTQGFTGSTVKIIVNVYDKYMNLVPNIAVTINGVLAITDANGAADAEILLNNVIGPQIVTSSVKTTGLIKLIVAQYTINVIHEIPKPIIGTLLYPPANLAIIPGVTQTVIKSINYNKIVIGAISLDSVENGGNSKPFVWLPDSKGSYHDPIDLDPTISFHDLNIASEFPTNINSLGDILGIVNYRNPSTLVPESQLVVWHPNGSGGYKPKEKLFFLPNSDLSTSFVSTGSGHHLQPNGDVIGDIYGSFTDNINESYFRATVIWKMNSDGTYPTPVRFLTNTTIPNAYFSSFDSIGKNDIVIGSVTFLPSYSQHPVVWTKKADGTYNSALDLTVACGNIGSNVQLYSNSFSDKSLIGPNNELVLVNSDNSSNPMYYFTSPTADQLSYKAAIQVPILSSSNSANIYISTLATGKMNIYEYDFNTGSFGFFHLNAQGGFDPEVNIVYDKTKYQPSLYGELVNDNRGIILFQDISGLNIFANYPNEQGFYGTSSFVPLVSPVVVQKVSDVSIDNSGDYVLAQVQTGNSSTLTPIVWFLGY